ncbi:MAG: VTT domain-containing protein [Saprospiraceae bacterium]
MPTQLHTKKWVVRQIAYWVWITAVVIIGSTYLAMPDMFSPERVVKFIKTFEGEMMIAYIIATFLRGFFLIPSTPFVVGGALLFPNQLLLVLAVSMAGVMFSASLLYYFSDALGFSKKLEEKASDKVTLWKNRLRKPQATFFVLGWSFFPLVPTDVICYVAGIVKMPYRNMFIGVFLGELILDIFYVYFGQNVFTLLSA